MNLIVIVIALAAERLLSHIPRWREFDWFGRYLSRIPRTGGWQRLWRSPWGLLVLVPPLALVALLQALLQDGVVSLLGLVFALAVLVFSLGPRDLWQDVRLLLAARDAGDDARAAELAAVLGVSGQAADDDGALVRAIVLAAHERLFAVLLWFFVLGPLGALLYRLAASLPEHVRALGGGNGLLEASLRLHGLLAWVPQRITALLYGLAGSSDAALSAWRGTPRAAGGDWNTQGWRRLAATGCGALQMEEGRDRRRVELEADDRIREALGLVTRSLILLLAVFSAFTIGGWMA